MARITGGEVTYMERRKIGDYEHKEAKAVLTFSLDDGDDHDSTLNTLTFTAKQRVHEMLGLTGRTATPSTPAPKTAPAATTTAADLGLPVKRGPGRPPSVAAKPAAKVEPVVEAPKPAPVEPAPVEAPVAEVPKVDPVDDIDALLAEPVAEIKKIEPDPVTEVTDAMLTSEVTRVMKKINNPVAIKDVIRKTLTAAGITNTTGKQLRDIPMAHRPAFVQAVGAL